MKREAVQEERQRGAKMLPKQTDDINQTNPVRDLTIERLLEAEQKTESGSGSGDNVVAYLRVGANSVVQNDYKVIQAFEITLLFFIESIRFIEIEKENICEIL